jgi:uncharacterized membrane protein YidH (DUF202 family)
MTRNLRISLTILSIGFAIEGVGEAYTRFTPGSAAPGESLLYLFPLVLTGIGLLFVWVGRGEWNAVHIVRVRTANRVFAASLLGAIVAAAVVGLLLAVPSLGTPPWAELLYGAAIGSLVFGTFVTYAYLVFHLVSVPGQVVVALALAWALFISVAIAFIVATSLPSVLSIVSTQSLAVPAFVAPVDFLASALFVSYFLLLIAFIEAHVAVARGRVVVSGSPGVPVTRVQSPKAP